MEQILVLTIKSVLIGIGILYLCAAYLFFRAKDGIIRKLIITHFLCGAWTFITWGIYLFSETWDNNTADYARLHSLMFFISFIPLIASLLVMYFPMLKFFYSRNERRYGELNKELEASKEEVHQEYIKVMERRNEIERILEKVVNNYEDPK